MGHLTDDRGDKSDRLRVEFDPLYQNLVGPARWVVMQHSNSWRPPTDVFETDEAVVVRVEVAGMRETDFSIALTDQMLIIAGVREDPSPKVAYHQMEVCYGEFRVEVFLHWTISESDIQAVYDNGFLQVTLPRARKRQIRIVEAGG